MNAKSSSTLFLNKGWATTEKVIAILLILWGLFSLYNAITVTAEMIGSTPKNATATSYWYIVKINHLSIILSVLSIFGGFLLLYNDKYGWLLSIVSCIMYCISFFISSRSNTEATDTYARYYKSYGITAILLLIISIILLLKPFRQKYQPVIKSYVWITVLLILLLIDKIIF